MVLTNKRYLIEGQGNFGNIFTGDPAAAPRYIECRLTELARAELFNDALTEFVPSYDGRNQEPITLPSKLPLLLMLGTEGIAVGMSCKILPHNFPELLAAQIAILKKQPFKCLPDFPTGGLMDARDYRDGQGTVKVRAKIEVRSKYLLAITELPFGATTESVIESILAWPNPPSQLYAFVGGRTRDDVYPVSKLNQLIQADGNWRRAQVHGVVSDDPGYMGYRGKVENLVPTLIDWAQLGVDVLVAGPTLVMKRAQPRAKSLKEDVASWSGSVVGSGVV